MMLFAGCKDFLNVAPEGYLTDENLGTTAESIDELVIAAYAALDGMNGDYCYNTPFNNWIYGEVRAGSAYKGGGGTTDIATFHEMEIHGNIDPANSYINDLWERYYYAIGRCNNAIRAIVNSKVLYNNKEARLAEVKCVRAHFYFNLLRLYNKIPFVDYTMDEAAALKVTNTEMNRDQWLEFLATEFEEASKDLPDVPDNIGRVDKYVALAFAAKVRLYKAYPMDENNRYTGTVDKNEMEKVVNYCDQVINSGRYRLLDDFAQLSLIQYEHSGENIFAVEYSINDGTTNGRYNRNNLLNTPRGAGYGGDDFYKPSQNSVNMFKTDENGLPLFDTYNDNNLETRYDGLHKFSVDPRLDMSIGRDSIQWKTYTEVNYLKESWSRDGATYGYYACKKFHVSPDDPNMFQGWPWGASALNQPIIRYADLLLWKAEALVELGRQTEALPYINAVRQRAINSAWVTDYYWNKVQSGTMTMEEALKDGGYIPELSADGKSYAANYKIALYEDGVNCQWTQEYARKAVHFERRLELLMEGDLFFDLVRWGEIESYWNDDYCASEKHNRAYLENARFISGMHEFLPVPTAQNELVGLIYSQNAGYTW